MIEPAAQGVDAALPLRRDLIETAIGWQFAFVDRFLIRALDFHMVNRALAADLGAALAVGIAGGFIGNIDHTHRTSAFTGQDGGVQQVAGKGVFGRRDLTEFEGDLKRFAGAEAGQGDLVAGFGKAEQGGELAFVDEHLVADAPEDVQLAQSGCSGRAVLVDRADDETNPGRQRWQLGGDRFIRLGDLQPEPGARRILRPHRLLSGM